MKLRILCIGFAFLEASTGFSKAPSGASLGPPATYTGNVCDGVKERVAFQNRFRKAQLQGFALLRPGMELVYRLVNTSDEKGSPRHDEREERWTVRSIDKKALTAEVEVAITDALGNVTRTTRVEALKPVGMGKLIPGDSKECVFSFLYFDKFGSRKVSSGSGKKVPVLWRDQRNLGRAAFHEAVSAKIPFSLVERELRLVFEDGHETVERRDFLGMN